MPRCPSRLGINPPERKRPSGSTPGWTADPFIDAYASINEPPTVKCLLLISPWPCGGELTLAWERKTAGLRLPQRPVGQRLKNRRHGCRNIHHYYQRGCSVVR